MGHKLLANESRISAAATALQILRLVCKSRGRRRLIDDQPVETELLDEVTEFIEVNRFLAVTVNPQLVTFHHISLFLRRGHDDNRNSLGAAIVLHGSKHLYSVSLG